MSWRSLIWDSGTLPSGTTATFKGRSCSGSGGTGNCGTWESSSLSVGGILTFTSAVSNERYLQIQADLASDTNRQSTPTVGEVDLTYQITSTLPSVKYYYLGSQRVAMRGGNEVYYLHGDHLGSTSLTTNVTGTVVAETRHHPFGEVRWQDGMNVTDFGFTGQRNEVGFGLMDYNARYYSPGLGRFVSADTITPGTDNSQAWNRYTYVFNNPLKHIDPSGHCAENGDEACWSMYETFMEVCSECDVMITSQGDIPFDQASYTQLHTRYLLYTNKSEAVDTFGFSVWPDADVYGVSVTYSPSPTIIQGPIYGAELLTPNAHRIILSSNSEDLIDPGIFYYQGVTEGLSAGLSISPSGGYVWNLPDTASYEGPFEVITLEYAYGTGASLNLFWAPDFSINNTFGFSVGPAFGLSGKVTHSTVEYFQLTP